jgi:3-phenylpropionate/cinnamic acid dioxygenase small subunit
MALTVEDKLELLALPGRYGNAIDDRDWATLRVIFTEDAIFDSKIALDVVMNGVEEIIDFMDKTDYHPLGHLMTNIDITETDEGVAMRFRAIFPLRNADGSLMPSVVRHGCYYDKMVRTPGGWRVKHRLFTRLPKDKKPTAKDLEVEARFHKSA